MLQSEAPGSAHCLRCLAGQNEPEAARCFRDFINDRNVIVFGDEAFGDGCANSSRSDDQYLHELEVCLFDWRP